MNPRYQTSLKLFKKKFRVRKIVRDLRYAVEQGSISAPSIAPWAMPGMISEWSQNQTMITTQYGFKIRIKYIYSIIYIDKYILYYYKTSM